MTYSRSGQCSQIGNPKIVSKTARANQHHIATMSTFNPFSDNRRNVIDIIIMTKKKERFHTYVMIGCVKRKEMFRSDGNNQSN